MRKHIKREREIIVMEITHPRIVGFFKEHVDLNPEETILKFIDIMESLHENMNKTMNNSVVSEILDSIKSMQGKLDTVSNDVNKITGDTQTQFALKMTEFKQFEELLTRMLRRRGKDRATYKRQLEDHFCKVWYDTMMTSSDQLKELMKDKKELRRLVIELNQEHKKELDDLERQLEKLKPS